MKTYKDLCDNQPKIGEIFIFNDGRFNVKLHCVPWKDKPKFDCDSCYFRYFCESTSEISCGVDNRNDKKDVRFTLVEELQNNETINKLQTVLTHIRMLRQKYAGLGGLQYMIYSSITDLGGKPSLEIPENANEFIEKQYDKLLYETIKE